MENKLEVLKDAYNYIDNLNNGIEELGNAINSGNEEKGVKLIPLICDGIEWITQVVSLTRDMQKEEISIGDLNEKLGETIEALDNEDFILVGDLFSYEIAPILNDIKSKLGELINR
ncbi:hypothetical protein [Clostridium saccharoperbutylacetonicum]|uniref:hypothetical protein n=1 Tax=Clostridium saccharoperbutylacetonicum TaxID=36745 RepID=UPI000983C467|nr:hypothetical protein [Clostridium saccharoperbutylacetonicum]AQR97016.1 hypothetical protein CLSAP_43400 [Clostridium saccharoperbutylacetonicum]NSB32895.1 hypothetical protein [Clostridium saccharoperbutylacetonicum]